MCFHINSLTASRTPNGRTQVKNPYQRNPLKLTDRSTAIRGDLDLSLIAQASAAILPRPATVGLDTLAILKVGTATTGATLDKREKNQTNPISSNPVAISELHLDSSVRPLTQHRDTGCPVAQASAAVLPRPAAVSHPSPGRKRGTTMARRPRWFPALVAWI